MDALALGGAAVLVLGLGAIAILRARRRSEPAGAPKAPWSRNETISVAGIVVGAGVGIAGLVLSNGGGDEPPAQRSGASASAVAALIRQGPFTGRLPDPLKAGDIVDVDISDSSAANRVDAVELEADPADAVKSFFSHMEVYATARAATARARARIAEIKTLHGATHVNGSPTSYCAYLQATWECGGTSGLVYAEATVSPDANAYRRFASGSAAALLRYADEKARVAAE